MGRRKRAPSGDNQSSKNREGLAKGNKKTRGGWKPVLLLAVIVIIFVLAKGLGLGERLGELRQWIASLGKWGPLAFIVFYVLAVVAALPGSALTVVAGAIFGSVSGVILVSIAATLGASLAFLIARYFARDAAARWLSQKEKFRRLDQLTEEHGAVIVALTRLVPIFPFNLLNYGFGLTRVPFWTYLFWSWLCMLPGTVLYVVGADVFTSGISQRKVPWVLMGALAGAGSILAILVRYARGKLKASEPKAET
jgi:uncharacterized membrane protein YdjX (TVP38/TMEM64 family)